MPGMPPGMPMMNPMAMMNMMGNPAAMMGRPPFGAFGCAGGAPVGGAGGGYEGRGGRGGGGGYRGGRGRGGPPGGGGGHYVSSKPLPAKFASTDMSTNRTRTSTLPAETTTVLRSDIVLMNKARIIIRIKLVSYAQAGLSTFPFKRTQPDQNSNRSQWRTAAKSYTNTIDHANAKMTRSGMSPVRVEVDQMKSSSILRLEDISSVAEVHRLLVCTLGNGLLLVLENMGRQ